MPRLEQSLGVEARGQITVVLVPAGPIADPEIARLDRAAPPWAAGFALNPQRLIAIRLGRAETYPFGDASAVLAHEIAHVLLDDAVRGGSEAGGPAAVSRKIPRWFSEGVATREQRRWGVRDAVVYSSSLMLRGLPTLGEMNRAFLQSEISARRAYAASFDFVNWSSEEYGEDLVRRVLAAARTRPFPEAWQAATGVRARRLGGGVAGDGPDLVPLGPGAHRRRNPVDRHHPAVPVRGLAPQAEDPGDDHPDGDRRRPRPGALGAQRPGPRPSTHPL